MPVLKQLVEKREELASQQKKLRSIFAEAKGDPAGNSQEFDLSLIKSIEGDDAEKMNVIRKLNEDLDALGKEVDALEKIDMSAKSLADEHRVKGGQDSETLGRFATKQDTEEAAVNQGWGDLFVGTDIYKIWRRGKGLKAFVDLKARLEPLIKTAFTTAAGWAPQSIRIGRMVEDAQRPIEVIDIIPGGQTTQAAVVFMEETTFTNNADFRAENAAYAENAFALTEQSETVRSIGASLPVTDEQMADVAQVRSYLNQRMGFAVRQQLDAMILTASGVAPEWTGVNSFTGIQTQAKGADPTPDAFYKALDLVRYTGRANPTNIVMHSNDWQPIRLLRTSDGVYIWGNPSDAGPMRMWGLPVLVTTAQTENTGLVGDFAQFCQYFVRQDMAIEMGYVNDDFLDGRVTIRAGIRGALVGFRGAAFSLVTGI